MGKTYVEKIGEGADEAHPDRPDSAGFDPRLQLSCFSDLGDRTKGVMQIEEVKRVR